MSTSSDSSELNSTVTLLDIELRRLDDLRREHGWTPWILLAALGTLSWQLTEYLASSSHWERVGIYWAILVLLSLTAENFVGLLNSSTGPQRPGVRYFRANLLAAGRSVRLFAAIEVGVAAILLCWLTPLTGLVETVWLSLFSFYFYVGFANVAGSWTDFPQPIGTPKTNNSKWLVPLAIWLLHIGLLAIAAVNLWPRLIRDYNVADARVALLGFATTYLIHLLLGFRIDQPLRRELIHLRRVIGLGEINAVQARARLSELLYGSDLSVLLQPRFEAVEQLCAELDPCCKSTETALLATADGGDPSEAKSRLANTKTRFDCAESAWMSLDIRVRVCRWVNEVPADVERRHADLKSAFQTQAERFKSLVTFAKTMRGAN